MKLEFSRQIFDKYSNIKLHENRTVEAQLFHADGRTDMTQLTVAFRIFLRTHLKTVTVRAQQLSCVQLNAHIHRLRTKPNSHLYWLWWSSEPGNDVTACVPHVRLKLLGPLGPLPTWQHCRYWCSHANTNPFETKFTTAPSTVTNSITFQLKLPDNFIPTCVRVTKR